jgi:hypothetical protein
MISAVVSEAEDRGFGIHVSAAEWEKIKPIYDRYNQAHEWFRVPAAADAEDGRRQIGVCVFEYGGNKTKNDSTNDDALTSGWWNCAKFQVQVKFLVECFDILYGDTRQLLLQGDRRPVWQTRSTSAMVDWSRASHARGSSRRRCKSRTSASTGHATANRSWG